VKAFVDVESCFLQGMFPQNKNKNIDEEGMSTEYGHIEICFQENESETSMIMNNFP